MADEYKVSWRGKTTRSLKWYMFIMIPLVIGVGLWEDFSNSKSPRVGWWKNRLFGIPDFDEWFMYEGPNAALKQQNEEDKANKEAEKAGDPKVKALSDGKEPKQKVSDLMKSKAYSEM